MEEVIFIFVDILFLNVNDHEIFCLTYVHRRRYVFNLQNHKNGKMLRAIKVALLYFYASLQVKCDFWTYFFCAVRVAQEIRAMGFKCATVNFALPI